MAFKTAAHLPSSTYRFQLHRGFPFSEVVRLAPYLDALGVSDCYFSPIFRAVAGSTHGYDVSDLTRINPELGGEAGFEEAVAALQARGMECLLDFVPNHMGIAGSYNHWWLDVLENGRQSRYARHFDIEWYPRHAALRERILVPMLGDYYGKELEAGKLRLEYAAGRFAIRYFQSLFPLKPESTLSLLDAVAASGEYADREGRLGRVRSLFHILPEPEPDSAAKEYDEREEILRRARAELKALGEVPEAASAFASAMARINGDGGEGSARFDRLHTLLEEQHYRLAFWKTGAHETNYRRFFAVDTLIGLRVEEGRVLRETHAKLAELIGRGLIGGVRLDHIDGLWDPADYLADFHSLCVRPLPDGKPFYLLVEKILEAGEKLPASWPLHGTTGYEFIAQLGGLFTDPAAEASFSETFAAFTGIAQSAADLIYEKKRFVLEELFANTIGNLALGLDQVVEFDRRWRDLTMHDLRVATRETMACLSVYRTYRRTGHPAEPEEAAVIRAACEEARRRNRCLDPVPFEFVRDVLLGLYAEDGRARLCGKTADDWTLKFQQATGAVMAKSVEDTAFYVFNRFSALNEVGCDPGRFGATVEEFHAANAARLREMPQCLLTTSTHDTKVSEDVRARLYSLSERPDHWRCIIEGWAERNRAHKTRIEERLAPDADEEYLLYQILLGSWPPGAEQADAAYVERIRNYMRKAVSEAKVNTNWIYPNQPWMEAVDRFVERLLDPAGDFLPAFLPEARAVAAHGMVNSLAQVVLKLASPGVPDLYQGNEAWEFNLVDPDNRRPIDYDARLRLLETLDQRAPADLLAEWGDGGIKMHVTRALLRFRRSHPGLFQQGDYLPVAATGPAREHVVAFRRAFEGVELLAVVPRFPGKVGMPPLGAAWGETRLESLSGEGSSWTDLLTGRKFEAKAEFRLADLLEMLPCAVLVRS